MNQIIICKVHRKTLKNILILYNTTRLNRIFIGVRINPLNYLEFQLYEKDFKNLNHFKHIIALICKISKPNYNFINYKKFSLNYLKKGLILYY
jgi:hypothetical protein